MKGNDGPSIAWRTGAGLLVILCLLLPSAIGQSAPEPDPRTGTGLVTFYVKAKATDSGPYLTLDPEASSAATFNARPATYGPSSLPRVAQGDRGQPIEFVLDNPLPQDYWLNVSATVKGSIYWTSTAYAALSTAELGQVHVEVWVDGALVMGSAQQYAAGSGWRYVSLQGGVNYPTGRVELAKLPAGSSVTLKVFTAAVTADLQIGTGGARVSSFTFQFFDTDPLANVRYVADGQTVALPASAQSTSTHGDASGWAGAGAVALGLCGRVGRRRAGLVALVAMLGATAFAGCLGGDAGTRGKAMEGDPAATGAVNVTTKPDAVLEGTGRGAVEGYTRDGDGGGVPIAKAHVFLIGTEIFTETDKSGRYLMGNVSANTYRLHVDAAKFASVEIEVPVIKGQRTWVNISLSRPNIESGGQVPHIHDEWGGEQVKTLFDGPVQPGSAIVAGSPLWYSTNDLSQKLFELPYGTLVLPGTARIEAILDWPQGTSSPTEMGFNLATPGMRYDHFQLFHRGPKKPFNFPILPNEADAAHQHATTWRFGIRNFGAEASNVEVRVVIKIHKGLVPYEPAHPLFWKGATELPLVAAYQRTGDTYCCYSYYYPTQTWWYPDAGRMVPPGAAEIRGTYTWSGGVPTINWRPAYHSADMPPGTWKKADGTLKGANTFEFVIPLKPEMTDSFYQKDSLWKFSHIDDMPETVRANSPVGYGAQTTWTFKASVHRDPDYVELPPQ